MRSAKAWKRWKSMVYYLESLFVELDPVRDGGARPSEADLLLTLLQRLRIRY